MKEGATAAEHNHFHVRSLMAALLNSRGQNSNYFHFSNSRVKKSSSQKKHHSIECALDFHFLKRTYNLIPTAGLVIFYVTYITYWFYLFFCSQTNHIFAIHIFFHFGKYKYYGEICSKHVYKQSNMNIFLTACDRTTIIMKNNITCTKLH